MSRMIEVLISPTGETKIETRGFAGPACQQATKALEATLGLKTSESLTAEYHQPASQTHGLTAKSNP